MASILLLAHIQAHLLMACLGAVIRHRHRGRENTGSTTRDDTHGLTDGLADAGTHPNDW
ncbi:MAG: hypothetical protein WDM77_03935 [Steroidobacteraceae bacterium]